MVSSFGKINLTLDVLDLMPDGFHAIESVMQTISLRDTVSLVFHDEPGIRVTCNMPEVPTDEGNLAYKAAALFLADAGIAVGVDIHIDKSIPPEAGLGGGSSNAAAVLKALATRFGLVSDAADSSHPDAFSEKLNALAAKIGSDVPFFLTGGTALVSGRGEHVQPLPDIPTQWLVIVIPPFGVSTRWAYRRLDQMRGDAHQSKDVHVTASRRLAEYIERISSLHSKAGKTDVGLFLHNDLELPVVQRYPEIRTIKDALLNAGASGALMCGSGSAVFGLFASEVEASAACDALDAKLGKRFVVQTIGRQAAR
ncbi:MAG: 4-(cytidine 5'-diphospho)-2-C-methyl-D-erythritol kinase [Armatimonadetes bacterium]|nr:4-(cytidine 5'-diphospho)-2-C-methyl-D-erythritol kinase [Armatimonadota bacterium]